MQISNCIEDVFPVNVQQQTRPRLLKIPPAKSKGRIKHLQAGRSRKFCNDVNFPSAMCSQQHAPLLPELQFEIERIANENLDDVAVFACLSWFVYWGKSDIF